MAVRAGAGFEILITVGACAVVSLACGVFAGWSAGIAWSAGLLGLEYVLSLFVGGASLDFSAPLIGAGLLLTAELGYWSIELRAPIRDDLAVHQARARVIGALVAGGVLVAAVPLLVAQLAPGGALLTMIGVVAAVGVLTMLMVLGWRAARAA